MRVPTKASLNGRTPRGKVGILHAQLENPNFEVAAPTAIQDRGCSVALDAHHHTNQHRSGQPTRADAPEEPDPVKPGVCLTPVHAGTGVLYNTTLVTRKTFLRRSYNARTSVFIRH